ncbi:MAG TPA: hypothetical protein VN633_15915 [Bryobacteraceae bacterium]|nr:hypothetical protein [Bryobacteraceae bacterium]
MRYELWTQPVERHNQLANFLPALGQLVYPTGVTPTGMPPSVVGALPADIDGRSSMRTDRNNFAPRLGLAYQLTPTTVLRAGAGMFYADDPFVGASGRLVANPPFFKSFNFPTDQITPVLFLDSGFPDNVLGQNVDIGSAALASWAPDMKQGYVNHWSFGIQKQFGNNVVEANYVGTNGVDMPLGYNLNAAYPGQVRSPRAVR